MSNITENIQALTSPQIIQAASISLGESESSVSKAINGIIPTLITGILNSRSESHEQLSQLLSQAGAHQDISNDLFAGLSAIAYSSESIDLGKKVSDLALENNRASVSNIISNFAGIKSSSSTLLLNVGAALTAVFLGQKMKAENLSFNSILAWLSQHKSEIAVAMPGALSPAMNDISAPKKNATTDNKTVMKTDASQQRSKWVFPLILLALVGIGLFWWMQGCNNTSSDSDTNAALAIDSAGASIDDAVNKASTMIDSAVTEVPDANAGIVDSSGNWIATKGDSVSIKLNNGVEINTFKGSLEDKLHLFITDPGAKPGEDVWFNFEDLLFEPNKAVLKKGAENQLSNTVEILKAYPEVKIRLGGYTDNTGDSLKNVKLSEQRAKAVYNQLIAKGLTKTSFDAKPFEGYGPLHPVADNATPEGRAQNRRISLSVRAK